MNWPHQVAFFLALLMIPYGIAIAIWPRLQGSKQQTLIRWTGIVMVITYTFIVADYLHLIG